MLNASYGYEACACAFNSVRLDQELFVHVVLFQAFLWRDFKHTIFWVILFFFLPFSCPLGRLWQEKTILVKPNENGYGFSLSGEQPVYLEKLTEGSPAYLAGIRSRDKLIKVNGQSVFDKKHSEVVALLKGKFC